MQFLDGISKNAGLCVLTKIEQEERMVTLLDTITQKQNQEVTHEGSFDKTLQ